MLHLVHFLLKLCILSSVLVIEVFSNDQTSNNCSPERCKNGPNFTAPFIFPSSQLANCGSPGFELRCNSLGYPIFQLPENAYVIENISYSTQTIHVYDEAVITLDQSPICLSQIRNTTLPPQFKYVNSTWLHLFPNCSKQVASDAQLWMYRIICNRKEGYNNTWDLAIENDDARLTTAMEKCEEHVAAPVEYGIDNVYTRLRRGFDLKWNTEYCTTCGKSGGLCSFDGSNSRYQCLCPEGPQAMVCVQNSPNESASVIAPPPAEQVKPKGKSRKMLVIKICMSSVAVSLFVICIIFYRKKSLVLVGLLKTDQENQVDIEVLLKNHENLAPKRYRYSQLKGITNSFSESLGRGGYGTVYKGRLPDGRLVAVKILGDVKGNGEEFINEVSSFSRTSHVNVVALLGFCFEDSKRALIYEFMPNGSLEKFIPYTASSTAEGSLGCEKLFEIAVGIARGLEYLHEGCTTRILHFDIKPQNILLDMNLKPKISDFGLAKLCPSRASIVSMRGARGTAGYIAPEVFCRNFGEVSHKSDVYSYGMLILEMVVGRKNDHPNDDRSSEMCFSELIYKRLEQNVVKDVVYSHKIGEGDESKLVNKLLIIGLWCIQTDPKNRPSITRVVEMLEGKLESLQIPPRPDLCT